MIEITQVNKYCREDISLIENYQIAVNDDTQTWNCHHKDEVKTLPSGIKVYRSREELIENDRYYNCPANELIFLTKAAHNKIHCSGKPHTASHNKAISNGMKGHKCSAKARRSCKPHTASHNKAISNGMKGHKCSDECRKKMAEARRLYWQNRKSKD